MPTPRSVERQQLFKGMVTASALVTHPYSACVGAALLSVYS